MSNWREGLYAATAEYLRKQGVNTNRVTSVEGDWDYRGHCSNCSERVDLTVIVYLDAEDHPRRYEIDVAFSEFINDFLGD